MALITLIHRKTHFEQISKSNVRIALSLLGNGNGNDSSKIQNPPKSKLSFQAPVVNTELYRNLVRKELCDLPSWEFIMSEFIMKLLSRKLI